MTVFIQVLIHPRAHPELWGPKATVQGRLESSGQVSQMLIHTLQPTKPHNKNKYVQREKCIWRIHGKTSIKVFKYSPYFTITPHLALQTLGLKLLSLYHLEQAQTELFLFDSHCPEWCWHTIDTMEKTARHFVTLLDWLFLILSSLCLFSLKEQSNSWSQYKIAQKEFGWAHIRSP